LNLRRPTAWQIGLFVLGMVVSVFHLWLAADMRFLGPIGTYFTVSGALFLVGGVLALVGGRGFVFKLGASGLIALSVIDNALLYYTRTAGMGFLFSMFPSSRSFPGSRPNSTLPSGGFSGNFTRAINGTFTRTFNGTFTGTFRAPLRGGIGWSSSWVPPGSIQFFVLQTVIIVVGVVALWRVSGADKATAGAQIVTGSAQPPS
jgi:hypothetical protein